MRNFSRGVMDWSARKGALSRNWLLEKGDQLGRLLETVHRRPVRKPKRKPVRTARRMAAGNRDPREISISDTKNPDKMFQIALVVLAISVVGLATLGMIYLIIGWAMR